MANVGEIAAGVQKAHDEIGATPFGAVEAGLSGIKVVGFGELRGIVSTVRQELKQALPAAGLISEHAETAGGILTQAAGQEAVQAGELGDAHKLMGEMGTQGGNVVAHVQAMDGVLQEAEGLLAKLEGVMEGYLEVRTFAAQALILAIQAQGGAQQSLMTYQGRLQNGE